LNTKFVLPVILIGAVQVASAAYMFESFETGVYTSIDGKKLASQSSAYATDGSYSMRIDDYTGGWEGLFQGYSPAAYDAWYAATAIEADVYFPAITAGWRQVQCALFTNSDAGWDQEELVKWVWLNPGQSLTQHVVWDITALKTGAPKTSGWFSFGILLASPGKQNANCYPSVAYIDNIQFTGAPVPEPLTMITLGGGVLALAFRRKRK